MKQLAIIGAGGHGKVVADIAVQNGYNEIVFLDDHPAAAECGGHPVIGGSSLIDELDCEAFVAIGNPAVRERILKKLKDSGIPVATLIHPAAVVAAGVPVGSGSVVMAGAVINPGAAVGTGCIINTCASVDHDCRLGDYVHIAVGAHLAGGVSVGDRTWVGIGAVVSNGLGIAADCMIGAGAAVVHTIENAGTYVGVPARRIK